MRSAKDRLEDRKRKKLRGMFLLFLAVAIVFSALLLRVWISDRAVDLAYEIDCLAAEKKSLEEGNRKLALEIARLRSPERISKIAVAQLNMVRSSDTEIIVLGK